MHKENQKRNKCLSYVTRNCDTDGQVKNIILVGLACDIINYGTEMVHERSYSNFNNTKTVLTSYLKFTFDILKL